MKKTSSLKVPDQFSNINAYANMQTIDLTLIEYHSKYFGSARHSSFSTPEYPSQNDADTEWMDSKEGHI